MGSLIQPNQVNQSSEFQPVATMDELLPEIVKGNVVLVLGHEGILRDPIEINGKIIRDGNVKEYMYQYFLLYKKSNDPNFNVSYRDFDEYFYNLQSDLAKLKKEIVKSLNDANTISFSDTTDYSPLLFELLRRKYFKLVLTTTYDYYVEEMLTKAWGKRPRVISIYDANNDIDKLESSQMDMPPTLYYVFGKALPNKDFVLIENDAMKVMEKWFAHKPKELLDHLSDKTILAMGTKFDDWLFRFFWFMLHRDIQDLRRGSVAISLNPKDSESDKKLCKYLDNENISHQSMSQTINEILEGYDEEERIFHQTHGKEGADIFLSYYSEDYSLVKHFFCSLDDFAQKEMHVNVWFDKSPVLQNGLAVGDVYSKVITEAIQKCRVFIPVITNAVKQVLEKGDGDSHYFFREEWRLAQQRKGMDNNRQPIRIMPICLDGVEIKDIHPNARNAERFDILINDVSVGTCKTQLEYKKFLAAIKEQFKNP